MDYAREKRIKKLQKNKKSTGFAAECGPGGGGGGCKGVCPSAGTGTLAKIKTEIHAEKKQIHKNSKAKNKNNPT